MYQRLKHKYYLVIRTISAFPHGLLHERRIFIEIVNDIHAIYIVYF